MTLNMRTPWVAPSIVFAYARGIVAYHLADAYEPVMDSGLKETIDERLGELAATGCVHEADRKARWPGYSSLWRTERLCRELY